MQPELIKKFYALTLLELKTGDKTIAEANESMMDFERQQKYEACAGIKKAIEEYLKKNKCG